MKYLVNGSRLVLLHGALRVRKDMAILTEASDLAPSACYDKADRGWMGPADYAAARK
jgi:hypothetical protein